jgi:hypothetical protein
MSDSAQPLMSTSPFVFLGLVAVVGACCLATFFSITAFVGSKDTWNRIKGESGDIWTFSMLGSIMLFSAGLFYFKMQPNHEKIMYFVFVVTFLAMGLAYSALGVALIHKNR